MERCSSDRRIGGKRASLGLAACLAITHVDWPKLRVNLELYATAQAATGIYGFLRSVRRELGFALDAARGVVSAAKLS